MAFAFILVHRPGSMSDDDDDHMSDRDMGAPSPGGMSSLGGGSRPSSALGGELDSTLVPSLDDTPLMNSTRTSRSASKAAAAAMAAAMQDDDEQVRSQNSMSQPKFVTNRNGSVDCPLFPPGLFFHIQQI